MTNKLQNKFKKIASFFVIVSLATSQLPVAAAPEISGGISSFPAEIVVQDLVQNLAIPQEFGTIQERFVNPNADSNTPTVVHIQDAHANYEAQKNIENIIDYLNREYGISLVLLEGGADRLDPKLIQVFKDPVYNSEMIDLLVRKGELTGVEAYLTQKSYESDFQIDTFGIEKAEYYKRDLEHFRSIWPNTESGRAFVERTVQLIDRAGSRTINKELRDFLREWQSFKESRSHLNSYLNTLKERAKTILKLDLTHPRNQREWPDLLRVYKLKEMESKLNLQEAKADWKRAKEFLRSINTNSVLLSEIEDKLYGRKTSDSISAESTRDIFQYLLDSTGDQGFSFDNYPQLAIWVGSVILQNEIESDQIFSEIERLNNQILDKLAPTPQEKHIIELFRQNYLLKDLFSLELTRENLERVKAAQELFKPSEVIRRIEAIDPTTDFGDASVLSAVEKLYADCLKSYEFAMLRESAFFENLSSAIKQTGKNKAITVCGGFHTKGFAEIFKANKMSYVIISPRITVFDDVEKEHANYVNSLMQIMPGQSTSVSTRSKPSVLIPDSGYSGVGGVSGYAKSELRLAADKIAEARGLSRSELRAGSLIAPAVENQTVQIGNANVTAGRFTNGAASIPVKSELRAPDSTVSAVNPARVALGRLVSVGNVLTGVRAELRSKVAEGVLRTEARNGVTVTLSLQSGVGHLLTVRGDSESRAEPAIQFGDNASGADGAYQEAVRLLNLGKTALEIRKGVEDFLSRELLADELRQSELRRAELSEQALAGVLARDRVLPIVDSLFAKSELRQLSVPSFNTALDHLGVGTVGFSAQNGSFAVGNAISRLHLEAERDVFTANVGTTGAKIVRIFNSIPDAKSLEVEVQLAALHPESLKLFIYVESVSSEGAFEQFERDLNAKFQTVQQNLGLQFSGGLPIRISIGLPSGDEIGKNFFQKGVPVAIISENSGFLNTNFKSGEGRFFIHDDIGSGRGKLLEKQALSLIAAKLVLGLQDLAQFNFSTRPYKASELFKLTQTLEFLREVAEKLATAA